MSKEYEHQCEDCEHEQCPRCFNCHNMECGSFVEPFKQCFDILVKKES